MNPLRGRLIAAVELLIGSATVVAFVVVNYREGGPWEYRGMADRVVSGLVPYREFPFEYPPLALFQIVTPRLLAPGSNEGYDVLFVGMSLALTLATAAALTWLAARGWSSVSVSGTQLAFFCLVLAALPQVFWRFDIMPACFTLLAVVAVAANRPAWSGFALGLGAAAKLYPAVLLPVLLAFYVFSGRRRRAALALFGFLAIVVSTAAMLFVLAGEDGFTFLTYQAERGLEIESVLAGIVLLAHNLIGAEAVITFEFGSVQVESPLIETLSLPNQLALLALGVALAISLLASFRADSRRRADGSVGGQTLIRYIVASLLLAMIANKVLSPQYVAWLIPFGALLPRRQSLVLVVICALTTLIYPLFFATLRDFNDWTISLLNVRNALLLVLFMWLVIPRRSRAGEGQSVAMLEKPPSRPAPTPNISSPMASRRLCGAITVIRSAAKATVTTLASVSPGRPSSAAR